MPSGREGGTQTGRTATSRRRITLRLDPSSSSPRPTNGPRASCAVATHSAAQHARRTQRATARLATSCAGGPSARGAATRLSPSAARAKSNPGTVAADAATWGRRPGPRPNRNKPPSHHPAPRPQQQLAAPTKRPLRQLRCRYALSGSAARRTQRATARLATSCAGGPSARGSATRLSASGALPRPCPGLLRVGAVCPTRRSRARGSEGRAPRRGAGRSPAESPSQSPGRRPSRRGSGCYAARPSSGGLPRLLGTAGSRRRGRTCPRARHRRVPGWGWGQRP